MPSPVPPPAQAPPQPGNSPTDNVFFVLGQLTEGVKELQKGQTSLEEKVTVIQREIGGIHKEIGGIQKEIGGIQKEVKELQKGQTSLEEKVMGIQKSVWMASGAIFLAMMAMPLVIYFLPTRKTSLTFSHPPLVVLAPATSHNIYG